MMRERPDYCLALDEQTPCACGATVEGKDPVRGVCQARYNWPKPEPLIQIVLIDKDRGMLYLSNPREGRMLKLAHSPLESSLSLASCGLVSLWDLMAKYDVSGAHHALSMLDWEESKAEARATEAEVKGGMHPIVAKLDALAIKVAEVLFENCEKKFAVFEAHGINDHIQRSRQDIGRGRNWRSHQADLKTLREAIEGELGRQLFFHYEPAKAALLRQVDANWDKVLKAFKNAEQDIRQGVHCYASGHDTAAVFHMMRVAEHGLRALARERRVTLHRDKPLTHENWLKIIEEIEKKAGEIQRTAPAGDGKEVALAFYNGALAHLRALKDKYRNRVMHAREIFNPHEAADAMFHTKSLMEGLSKLLTDQSNRQIRWKF